MPAQSERNQFRRLIGDYGKDTVTDIEVKLYFDDAVREATEDFVNAANISSPVTDFDVLVPQYHSEIIYLAAINYLWDKAGKLSIKHSQTMGQASQDVGETFDRVMRMIDALRARYETIQSLGTDITMGNLSRFSKTSLTRLGGVREENARDR